MRIHRNIKASAIGLFVLLTASIGGEVAFGADDMHWGAPTVTVACDGTDDMHWGAPTATDDMHWNAPTATDGTDDMHWNAPTAEDALPS